MEDYRLQQSGQEVQDILNGAAMQTDLTEESQRAQQAEQALDGKIDVEETRAKAAEKQNADDIDAIEEKIPSGASSSNKFATESDVNDASQTLQGNIDAEVLRAGQAEQVLDGKIDAEETRAKAAEKQNADDIDAIEEKIPSGATSSNKLATEDYVNDKVATDSATFRGTYNLVSDLGLLPTATHDQIAYALSGEIATADNNDYAFVQIPTSAETPTEIAKIERYKFDGSAWAFEYELNNSGFTAAQLAAINSGITSGDVTKLAALPTSSELTTLLNGKQDTLTFDNVPTQGSNNPVKSGGVYSGIKAEEERAKAAEKLNADNIEAIEEKIPSGASSSNKMATAGDISSLDAAIEAIMLLIPSAATSLNQLADKAFVNSSIATATATFRGTYNLVNDLGLMVSATHAQIGAALAGAISDEDNNDYAFVQVPASDDTPTQIAKTERYKFNGTAWEYEYDLNNSDYTADQWAAINSGITAALVSKLSALPTNADLTTALGVLTDGIAAINAKIPSAASSSNKLVDTAAMQSYITQVLDTIDATFNVTSTDGHVTVQITQVNGVITNVAVTTSDIASAADLSLLAGRVTTAEGNISTNTEDIAELQDLYNALQQSEPVIIEPTDTWPVTNPSTKTIYRVVDRVNTPPQYYSDYMWNGTTMVLMAQYNNAIDPRPKKGSQNLVTSGGVFDNMGALDVSELNATENPHTLATYVNLSAAIAAIPSDYQKGGMSAKFVLSSDNKYVQYRLAAPNWSTDIHDWTSEDPYFIDKIMQEVNEAIDENTPIEIHGDVSNAPDEEDLTSVNIGGTDVLKFKDKAYNSLTYSGMGRKILRKNIVEGVNTLTQEMMSDANTIYVIQYDFTLGENITVPSNCILKFDGGSLKNGSLVLQNTLFDGVVKLGGDLEISGTCANQTAYQSWFENNDIDAFISFINNVSGVFGYEFIAGTFYPTKNINKEVDLSLKVVGNGCTLVYSKDDIDEDCQIHFYKNNTNPTEYNVTHDVTPETGGFTLNSIEGINKNDYLCIRDIATSSFNYTRNYQQGEFFKVREILSEQSRIVPENYPAGNYMHSADNMNKVYSISFGHIDIDNFNVQIATKEAASFGSSGIELDFLTGSIRNCHIEWFRYNLSLNNCINFIVENCNVISNSNVQTGIDNYGLSINNCQKIDVLGGIFYGGNHGIAVGGTYSNPYSIVNRYINICNAYAYSYREGVGINAHGDTSDINIRGCFTDGMDLSGKNINVIGNTLVNHNYKLIFIRECIGGFVNICDNLNVNIIRISYKDDSSNTNVFDNCVLSPLMAIISNNGGNSNDGVAITVEYLCYGNNTYIKQSKAIIDNSVIRALSLQHLTYNTDAIESYDGEFCIKNSIFNGDSNVDPKICVGDFYLLNNSLNAPFYNYSVKKSFIKGNIFKAALRRFITIVPEMICFEGNILYSGGNINLAYIDCAGKIVELYVKNNIVLHDSYYVINVNKTYNYKFKGFVEIPQNAQGFADYNPTTGSIDVSEVYFYTSMFNTIGKNPVMYGIFDDSFTVQRNKIINANYRQFGITSTRPDVSTNALNSEYFNTEKNRFNHCVPQPDYSAYVMQITAYKNNPSFAANLLVENSLYYLRINRGNIRKLYAVKNNEEFDENNSVLLYDAKDQLYTEADTIIKGVNSTTYPYLYAVSNNYSVTAFTIYNCTLKWIDDDGASAGVKRSGVFADKPDAADIYVGFKYFCTDKQTTEGATNGIEILYKGNNVWVDALGRVVS